MIILSIQEGFGFGGGTVDFRLERVLHGIDLFVFLELH